MVRKRTPLPRVGELVIGTVKKVFDYGAYLTLNEYNDAEAYLPWSEVSSKWVRDIRDFVREGQRVVVKVIRVDRRKGHIDVSLKRVNPSEQKRKLLEWKRAQRAEKILEIVAKKIGKSLDDAYNEVGWKLEDYYGEIYAGLEEATYRGADALKEAGVSDEWIEPLLEEVRKHIKIKRVKIQGIIYLLTLAPDGVERIRKVLAEPLSNLELDGDTKIKVYTIGAPKYRVEVTSTDYKKAEKVLQSYIKQVEKLSKSMNLEFSFEREKA
ncbi:MAG: translation initiation factor IF-2 subunit alpha [Desulfurococcales archaeon]|nr:translation initiation factor IF-2 subunit alpha [Desulfurococcales archaeon]